jgi:alanine racemase
MLLDKQTIPRVPVTHRSRPLRARVSLSALQNNYGQLKNKTRSKIWAALKANAYGHGIDIVAKALEKQADGFAVLELEEALHIRSQGFPHPILILEGAFCPEDWRFVQSHQLTFVIQHMLQIEWLENFVATHAIPCPIPVYLKTNTGMNRLGFSPQQTITAFERLRRLPTHITLMTHYARSDEGLSAVMGQNNLFMSLSSQLKPDATSRANSAAILQNLSEGDDWMRSGIAIYGSSPIEGITPHMFGLEPVMSLETEIININQIAIGDSIGYGAKFMAEEPMRIGIVACGYGDGYPRTAPTGTPIMVDGIKTRLIGRVSMDMLAVDLNPIPSAKIGSQVELWGTKLPVDEVAQYCGTNGYELLASLTARVPTLSVQNH